MTEIEQALRNQYRKGFSNDEDFERWFKNTNFNINFGNHTIYTKDAFDNIITKDIECIQINTKDNITGMSNHVYVPEKHIINYNLSNPYGRKCYVTLYPTKNEVPAIFHKWGSNYDEYESGPATYTVGIVEMENGKIRMVDPTDIRFER